MLLAIVICLFLYVLWDIFLKIRLPSLAGKHVMVTGGSCGIGKAVAIEAAKSGAHVTIVARDNTKLEVAKSEIIHACAAPDSQKITVLPMDVTQPYLRTESALIDLENNVAPVYMLVNCAGAAVCATVDNDTEENYRRMLDLNLLGSVFPTKALAKRMARRKEGYIVITTSIASLLGIYGMGAYCASKWALRGFAETLYQEVSVDNVSVTLCLPPDTNTPGFEQENLGKPEETKLICGGGGLAQPEDVAKKLLSDTLRRRFFSTIGVGNLLAASTAGLSPPSSWQEVLFQASLASSLRALGACFGLYAKNIIQVTQKKRSVIESAKKLE